MKVLITGGTGFIGLALARRLLDKGSLTGISGRLETIDEMLLFDVVVPETRPSGLDARVTIQAGDISDRRTVDGLIDRDDISVFHFASIVSAGAEQDFDLAMRVNLGGHRHLLEALRARGCGPRLVFASSNTVFGGPAMPAIVSDAAKQTPQTTYGATKAIGELLINDYTRKGFIDGRSARLPAVIVRPGKPNAAASGFSSAVFREPLAGIDVALPVGLDAVRPVIGHRTVVAGLIRLHELDGAALGPDRALGFPSITATVREMIDCLHRVGAGRRLGRVTIQPDPMIERIVASWSKDASAERALALGLPRDESLDAIVRAYLEDYVD